ncbi:MAG: glycine cleavage system aminomethyltransferase GcvT [Nitrososphaerota archaeon]|nr:glycine cleavage system aminomethyltransferase GcvT [Nitrososphaerota archaeon]
MPRVTQIFDAYGGTCKATEFAGYTMPLYFSGIIDECLAVRNSVGLFDVSHMGRVEVEGRGASKFLDRLMTVDASGAEAGRAMYGFMCNEKGGVIDDLIAYKHSDEHYTLVVNCSNRQRDLEWMGGRARGEEVTMADVTDSSILLAAQGPKAVDLLEEFGASSVKRFRFTTFRYGDREAMMGRTGYTGEDGFELLVHGVTHASPEAGMSLWKKVLEGCVAAGGSAAGLGARDTLRIEAGLPLHGHEIGEDITPIEAGLSRFVDLKKEGYVGKDAHVRQAAGHARRLVGLVLSGSAIPRSGNAVFSDGGKAGYITSGTYSPTVRRGIGMALVSGEAASGYEVEIRGTRCKAEITAFPFYDAEVYGFRRKKN